MQTSYAPADWQEDGTEERLRAAINKETSPDLLRKLYPLGAKLIKSDSAYGYPPGYVFKHARTKDKLSLFPIEVCPVMEPRPPFSPPYHNGTLMLHFSSAEVEVVLPPEK